MIKFRLLLHGKVVGYEKWYPGKFLEDIHHWEARPQWLYSVDGEYWNPSFIFHNKKDRCTGLDALGKVDIYENDILRYTDTDGSISIGKVEEFRYQWGISDKTGFHAFSYQIQRADNNYHEVLGNIHQNPELLK